VPNNWNIPRALTVIRLKFSPEYFKNWIPKLPERITNEITEYLTRSIKFINRKQFSRLSWCGWSGLHTETFPSQNRGNGGFRPHSNWFRPRFQAQKSEIQSDKIPKKPTITHKVSNLYLILSWNFSYSWARYHLRRKSLWRRHYSAEFSQYGLFKRLYCEHLTSWL